MVAPILSVVPKITLVSPLAQEARSATARPEKLEARGGARAAGEQRDELEARRSAARARSMSRHPAFTAAARPPATTGS